MFEETFNHRAFTGRSGTFFAFERLGSIYWHMVSKLLLAVYECYAAALAGNAPSPVTEALTQAYFDIRQGLGFNKSPAAYGAFPTDPYSHTPAGSGARQPGMTGQVKEEILTRWGELGVTVSRGALQFDSTLLRPDDFLCVPGQFTVSNPAGRQQTLPLPAGSLAFTVCQTLVIYSRSSTPQIEITFADGREQIIAGRRLDAATSRHIFNRDGQVKTVRVMVEI